MTVSLERLYHFRCDSCNKWWTVADAVIDKTDWYCTWCGTKHEIDLQKVKEVHIQN